MNSLNMYEEINAHLSRHYAAGADEIFISTISNQNANMADMTEAEQEEAGRAMLRAALDALGEFPGNADDEDQDETARRVVRALVAAGQAATAESRRFRDLKGERVFLKIEPADAVATAFSMWSEQLDLDIDEVSPASVVGGRYLGFAQGMAAARAMTEALDLMEEGSMFAFTSRGAELLAPKTENKE